MQWSKLVLHHFCCCNDCEMQNLILVCSTLAANKNIPSMFILGNPMLKGKYHGNLVIYQKLQIVFCQHKPKSIVQICYKLSPQCTETIDESFWSQMDWVRMHCNLKIVRLTLFKFSHFCSQNALEQVKNSRIQLISFSWCSRIIL